MKMKKIKSSLLALVICLMLLFVYLPTFVSADDGYQPLANTTYYVDTSFNSGTPGWHVTCWNNIHSAVENCTNSANDYTILVNGDGDIYNENVRVSTSQSYHTLNIVGNYTTTRPRVNGQGASKSTFELMNNKITISGFTVYNTIGLPGNWHGIAIGKTLEAMTEQNNITITNCYITQATDGVLLRGGKNFNMSNNEIDSTREGIWILGPGDNRKSFAYIYNNYIHGCTSGIETYMSCNNTILRNTISSSISYGIDLQTSSNSNLIYYNNVSYSGSSGIKIYASGTYGCTNNLIYNNNFIDNNPSVQVTPGPATRNFWNMSHPICGNFYSLLSGTDIYKGLSQNISGSDGIRDTSYTIATNNTDYYPYMHAFDGTYPNHLPEVTTQDATGVEETNATVHGILTDDGGGNGEICSANFEYGLTAEYGTRITLPDLFTKQSNLATLPTDDGRGIAFSHDSTYMAVSQYTTPYIIIYKMGASNGTYYKLPNPASLPTGGGLDVAFSHDSTYLAVAHSTSPYVTIYKRSGDTFTKLSNPAILPTGMGYGVAFSHDSTYMTVAHLNSPYITIYKRSGDTFTKQANPATLPLDNCMDVAFSHNSTYMAVASDYTPYVIIYKMGTSNGTYYKLPNPATLPPDTGYGVAFSHDSTYLAVAHRDSPYITIYKRSGDTFTKLSDPVTLPPMDGESVAFSHDSTYMAVGNYVTSPRVTVYKRSDDTFTKLSNPVTLPTGTGWDVAFSHDSTYMAVAHSNSPYATIYKISYRTGESFSYNLIGLTSGKLYHYRAYANNSVGGATGSDKTFLTKLDVSFSNEDPANESTGISINLATVNINITLDGLFNWTIGGDHITTNSSIDDINGTKQANVIGPLEYDTEYIWWVNASVTESYINNTYSFTTEPSNLVSPSGDISAPNARVLARETDGTLYAVYSLYDEETGVRNIMLASSTDNGTTWASIPISTNDVSNIYSYDATIATGQNGNIYIAWVCEDGNTGTRQIQCRFYQDDSWGDTLNVTELKSAVQTSNPAIAITSEDVVYFVWRQYDYALGYGVIISTAWDNITSFYYPTNLTDGTYDAYSPSIAISNDEWDTAYAIWGYEVYDAGNDTWEYGIEYTYTGEGWITPPIRITAEEGCSYENPCIAIDLDGIAHISCIKYNESSGIYQLIHFSMLYTDYSEPEIVCAVESIESTSISIDSNNVVYIVFDGEFDNSGITDNISDAVHIKRDNTKGIYNSVTESYYNNVDYTSPADTEWSYILDNPVVDPTVLDYYYWKDAVNSSPSDMVGNVIYMHIISEDRYFEMHFSYWQQSGGGGFSYTRYEIVDGDRVSNITFTRLTDEGIYYCSYNGTWSTLQLLISGGVYSANMIFAQYPIISGAETNIPETGFAFLYINNSGMDSFIMYYSNVTWQEPEINYPPSFGTPSPSNGSTNQSLSFTWQIGITDANGDTFNWTIECNNSQSSGANGASNGTKSLSLSGLTYNTTYTIWVNATDGIDWTHEWYIFTTKDNLPPELSNENPVNGSMGQSINTSSVSIDVNDAEGDTFDISIHGNNLTNVSLSGQTNGTFSANLTIPLPHDTDIWWYVDVQDSLGRWVNASYYFHTRVSGNRPPTVINENPANNSNYVLINSHLSVTAIDLDYDIMDVVFYWGNDTEIGTDFGVANNSIGSIYLPDYVWMSHNTEYTWYVEVYDGTTSNFSETWNFRTCKNYDLNGDGIINYLDVSALVSHYGNTIPQSTQEIMLRTIGNANVGWNPIPGGPGSNFLMVHETIPDDPATFVFDPGMGMPELYTMGFVPLWTYTITNVTLYARVSANVPGTDALRLETWNGIVPPTYPGSPPIPVVAVFPNFQNLFWTFTTDPYGGNWTWASLMLYAFGVDSTGFINNGVYMTQFYLDVFYNIQGSQPWDINNDGTVNYLDVSSLVSHYGESY